MEFNRIIKLLRKERGITQKQAALLAQQFDDTIELHDVWLLR